MFQRLGDKPYEDLGDGHISKNFRGSKVRVMSQQSIQSKGEMITSCISHDEKRSTMSGRLLGFSSQKSLHLGILL